MNLDFTLTAYEKLLKSFQDEGYLFYTFAEWCEKKPVGKLVILRHDIDKKPKNALTIARIEAEAGVKATYFFKTSSQVFDVDIIKKIASLGHEIGYHYQDFVQESGNNEKAILSFQKNLSLIRSVAPVVTISMDGCPWSKYDNRNLWKKYNYRDYGIIGEPYFDILTLDNVLYSTDTGRCWDGDKYNIRDKRINGLTLNQPKFHTTADFIEWVKTSRNEHPIMITTHPQRWTGKPVEWLYEYWMQQLKNGIKRLINKKSGRVPFSKC